VIQSFTIELWVKFLGISGPIVGKPGAFQLKIDSLDLVFTLKAEEFRVKPTLL
jgi:hypothetical protein